MPAIYGAGFLSRQGIPIRIAFYRSDDATWVSQIRVMVTAPWQLQRNEHASVVLINREFSLDEHLLDQTVLIQECINWNYPTGWWVGEFREQLICQRPDRLFKPQVAVSVGGVWQEDPLQGSLHNFNFSWHYGVIQP